MYKHKRVFITCVYLVSMASSEVKKLNYRRLFFLICIIIFSIAAALDASAPRGIFEGSEIPLGSAILRLGDENPQVQQSATVAIKERKVSDDQILLAWAKVTRLLHIGGIIKYAPDHWLRTRDAVYRLINLDKALVGLLDTVKNGNKDESILVRFVIEEIDEKLRDSSIKPLPGTVPLLAEALEDQDAQIRETAVQLLETISTSTHAKDAVPALINALMDENQDVQSVTVSALGQIAVAIPEVRPEITEKLIDMLNAPNFVILARERRLNSNFHVRVASSLESIGAAAVPSLLEALDSTASGGRYHAAIALAKIGSENDEATIPILTQALASPYPKTRRAAIYTLADLAKQPALVNQVIQSLVQVLERMEDTVENRVARSEAVHTLKEIAIEIPGKELEITEKLITALNMPNYVTGYFDYDNRTNLSNFHNDVVEYLETIGAVRSLLEALNATDASVRHHAAIALARIDSEHGEATIPILAEALTSPYLHTRARASHALASLGKEQPTFVDLITPIFVKVLKTTANTYETYRGSTFHEFVAADLAYINLPAITELLQSDDPYRQRLQRLAAYAFTRIPNPGVDDPEIKRRIVEILVASAFADFPGNLLINDFVKKVLRGKDR